jgi:hypothetical protein
MSLPLRGKSRRRGVFFIRRLRRLAQILSGLSCRCASSHAAGFFADWGRFSQIAAAEGCFLSADSAD